MARSQVAPPEDPALRERFERAEQRAGRIDSCGACPHIEQRRDRVGTRFDYNAVDDRLFGEVATGVPESGEKREHESEHSNAYHGAQHVDPEALDSAEVHWRSGQA